MTKYDDYKKNKDIKPDSLQHTLVSVVKFTLLLFGILGLALELFHDNGLLSQLLSLVFDSTMGFISAVLVLGLLYAFNSWMTSAKDNRASKRGNIPMYAMLLVGAYYFYRFVTTGSL